MLQNGLWIPRSVQKPPPNCFDVKSVASIDLSGLCQQDDYILFEQKGTRFFKARCLGWSFVPYAHWCSVPGHWQNVHPTV